VPQGSFTVTENTNIPISVVLIFHYTYFDSMHICHENHGEASKAQAHFYTWTNPINSSSRAFIYSGAIRVQENIPTLIKALFILHSLCGMMEQIFWRHGASKHLIYLLPLHVLMNPKVTAL
jgi:hypothetical protein